jgi:hypothetical protein
VVAQDGAPLAHAGTGGAFLISVAGPQGATEPGIIAGSLKTDSRTQKAQKLRTQKTQKKIQKRFWVPFASSA